MWPRGCGEIREGGGSDPTRDLIFPGHTATRSELSAFAGQELAPASWAIQTGDLRLMIDLRIRPLKLILRRRRSISNRKSQIRIPRTGCCGFFGPGPSATLDKMLTSFLVHSHLVKWIGEKIRQKAILGKCVGEKRGHAAAHQILRSGFTRGFSVGISLFARRETRSPFDTDQVPDRGMGAWGTKTRSEGGKTCTDYGPGAFPRAWLSARGRWRPLRATTRQLQAAYRAGKQRSTINCSARNPRRGPRPLRSRPLRRLRLLRPRFRQRL